jgi:hypothetical protein
MSDIMEKRIYRVICAPSEQKLAEKVNEALDVGWGLYGGVSCSVSSYAVWGEGRNVSHHTDSIFCQTLTIRK